MTRLLVIGHGGASAVAPANTLRSFDAALAAGVDMIEFDVRSRRGDLVLVHGVLPRRGILLDTALDHLGGPAFAGVGLNVDVKAAGYEAEVLAKLRAYGLTERALISSQCPAVIDRVRRLEPGIATAISVAGPLTWALRSRSARGWRRLNGSGDVMLHHRLVDAELVRALADAGRRVFAWTVDDARRVAVLAEAGVAGVVTANPGALRG